MSFKPYPKIKKRNPTRTLREKILSGKADGRQALKYIRESNYANDQGFEKACRIIENHLWGENWRENSSMNSSRGFWIIFFMKVFILETNLSPEITFKVAKKAFEKDYSMEKKISPAKAAYIEIGEYKRQFKKSQQALFKGNNEEAEQIGKTWEAQWN